MGMRISFSELRTLLRKHGIRPDKRLGQNFLVDPGALSRVVKSAGLTGQEDVLEIGAGLGMLTRRLAAEARSVVAVEFDERLFGALEETVGALGNVRLVQGDILNLDIGRLMELRPYRVVANIPYHITSAIIRHLMEATPHPNRVVLTVQREVAERIVAAPGKMNLLAIGVQLYGRPRVMSRIRASSFFPPPKVDSAVLRVEMHPEPRLPSGLIDTLFLLARAGFGQKRKQLRNSLSGGLGTQVELVLSWLDRARIDPHRRAQELSLEEWGRLAQAKLDSD